MSSVAFDLQQALCEFLAEHPQRRAEVELFSGFLRSDPAVFRREHACGHFTGSAWIVDAAGDNALLTLHAKLGRWLQLGGHADGEADLAAVALREAREESGLDALDLEPRIFDIDRHRIPQRGDEPEHWHYDVRFVLHARNGAEVVVSPESRALTWRPVRELAADQTLDPSLRRMAQMWLARA